ncbi:hypothetical protein F383_09222 [Gossypium arboreum]|uniref:Uncharacterized protein n=1 Tax=Gossypium arboreum TaxID=29729 RepID=A0A0B0PPT7_GOSAR|nr:hypothetical protein F383_09222 [Gossypium arboreum]
MPIRAYNREALSSHETKSSCEPCNGKLIRAIIRKLIRANLKKLRRAVNMETHESQITGSSREAYIQMLIRAK